MEKRLIDAIQTEHFRERRVQKQKNLMEHRLDKLYNQMCTLVPIRIITNVDFCAHLA